MTEMIQNCLIAVLIAFVIALIVVLIMKAQLKSVRPRNFAKEYLVQGSLSVTKSRDTYLRTHTQRTRRNTNN